MSNSYLSVISIQCLEINNSHSQFLWQAFTDDFLGALFNFYLNLLLQV